MSNKRTVAKILLIVFVVANILTNNVYFSMAANNKSRKVEARNKINKSGVERSIIVKYKDKKEKTRKRVKNRLKKRKVKVTKDIPNTSYELMEISDTEDIAEVINELRQDSDIESIQPNYELELFSVQDAVYSEHFIGSDINIDEAWQITKGSEDVIVGVIDGDVDTNHPEFADRIYQNTNEIPNDGIDNDSNNCIDDVNFWDFANDDNSVYDSSEETHGTTICGIIAARADGVGVTGISPNIKLLPLKFANGKKGSVWDAIKAIEYAEECGASVVNCSWGTDKYSPVLEKAIKDSKMCFICAAGNDGDESLVYPASYDLPNVISVGAVNKDLTLADFSNYGDTVDVAAPGVDIYSTYPENNYGYISGTSAAVPFVTGVAALIKSYKSELTASEISDIIVNNATVNEGLNVVDAGKVLNAASGNISDNELDSEELDSEIFIDIPENMQNIIENSTSYGELEDVDKSSLCEYFEITDECMKDLDSSGYSLVDAIRISTIVSKCSMSIEEVVKLVPLYDGLDELENAFSKLERLMENDISDEYRSQIMSLFKEGIEINEIWSCYIFCKTFGLNILDVCIIDENISDSYLEGYSEEEKEIIIDIVSNYNVKISVLVELINSSGLSIGEIKDKLIEEVDFLEESGELQDESEFKANRGQYSYKDNNNESINLNTGSLSLESTDLSLPGKNGLDLNIVTRYDSSEANLYKMHRSYSYSGGDTYIMTYNESNNFLGTGWSFGFSSLEGSYSEKYLHLSDGSTYCAIKKSCTSSHSTYKIGNGDSDFRFYYLGTDSKFSYGGYDSRYVIVYKDGKREYFSGDGKIIGIVDRFGNTIKFQYETIEFVEEEKDYEFIRLKKIIDSVGRVINFIYEDTETGKKVTIKLKDGSSIQYILEPIGNHPYRDANKDLKDYNLVEKIDLIGRSTKYSYITYSSKFDYTHDKITSRSASNCYSLLDVVKYPTGAYTDYDFKIVSGALTSEGKITYPMIKTRKDVDNGVIYNKQEYERGGSYTVADFKDGFEYSMTVIDELGNEVKYTFDDKHRKIKEEHKDTNGVVIELIDYRYNFGDSFPWKVITYKYDKDNTDEYIRTVQNYGYDKYNNLKYYVDTQNKRNSDDGFVNNEHNTIFTYNYREIRNSGVSYDVVNTLLTSKEYKKDANTTIREDYTLTSDNKSIDTMTIFEKIGDGSFVVKAKKSFKYDSYGNIKQELDYLEDNNWSNYITTNYYYDDNVSSRKGKFDGAYLTKKEVLGVKDADGNLVVDKNGNRTGKISEEYKYNNYGQMYEYTDANGNITKYSYDKTGRVLKTTLPDNQNKSQICSYNDELNTVTITDENGNKTRYDYDGLGNLIFEQVYQPAIGSYKNIRQYAYDSYLNLDWQKDLEGKTYVDYDYYNDGRLNTKKVMDYTDNNELVYQETYTYDDATSDGYSVVTKVIEGETNSPDIVTKTYINKHGMLEKVERVGSGKIYTDKFKYDYIGNRTEELCARASDEAWSETYTTKCDYDYSGRVVKQYNVKGDYITTSYDALGRIKSVTDIKGNKASTKYSTTYEYDNLGRVIKENIPFSKNSAGTIYNTVKKHYYDRNGNVVCEQISNNKPGSEEHFSKTEFKYNSRNLLEMVITYDNGVPENYTQYYYDSVGNKKRMYTGLSSPLVVKGLDDVTSGSDKNYSITKYDYNSLNLLSKMTDPLGKSESYKYDLAGRLKNKTDRNGNTTTFTYDALDNIEDKTVKNSAKAVLGNYSYKYYITGNRSEMSGGGTKVTYEYDDFGRLANETDSLSKTVKTYIYDANNNRKSFTLKKGTISHIVTSYDYDKMDRLDMVKENGTTVADYEYDDNGNRKTLTCPTNGNSTSYKYNLANKLETLTNKKGTNLLSKYTYTYYLDGNQASKTDSVSQKSTSYVYDSLGRLERETETINGAKEVSRAYTYDDYNNRETLSVEGETTTFYQYDRNNRLINEYECESIYLSDMCWESASNGNGPVEIDSSSGEFLEADGNVITLNEVTYEKGLGAHADSEIVYNLNGIYSRFISDVGIDDEVGSGEVKFLVYLDDKLAYDSGNMYASSDTQTINISVEGINKLKLVVDSVENNYWDHADWAGAKLINIESPLKVSTYIYDENGNQKSQTVNEEEETYLSDMDWESASNGWGPVEKDLSNGGSLSGDGNVITLDGVTYTKGLGTHADSEIAYNLDGKYSRFISDIGIDGESSSADAKFQVYLDGELTFDSGTMWSSEKKKINIDVEGKNELKLVTCIVGVGNGDHTDWAGARLTTYKTTGTKLYEYDGFNQLKKVTEGTNKYTYTYGGDGLRLTKTVNGVGSIHVWDGQQMVAELNESGAVISKYIRGINQIYMQDSDGVKKFYLFNGHGDVIHLTNTSGNVIKTYGYDAFGVEKDIDSSDVNPFRYCGEYFDRETGTIYLRARYYNPYTGRFITEDNYLGMCNDPLSLNLYTYCFNNPIMYFDPSGHDGVPINPLTGCPDYSVLTPTEQAELDSLKEQAYEDPTKWEEYNKRVADIKLKHAGDAVEFAGETVGKEVVWWVAGEKLIQGGLGLLDDAVKGLKSGGKKVVSWFGGKLRKVFGKGVSKAGKLSGSLNGLTSAERTVVNDLLSQGKNVEIIPTTTLSKTPDFSVNGVKTELKSLVNPNINTGITRIQKGFKQGAETVIIDGRQAGLTTEQANQILNRASGTYQNKTLPGQVEIWTNEGVIRR